MKLRVELIPAFLLIYTAFAFARTGNQVIRQECLIVAELESGKVVFKNDAGLCGSRIYAASTFKIPLALMAFDTGVITDSETMLKWDGTNQPIKSHERDHNAKTWLRDSVVWFSKRLTPQIGQSKIAAYLNDFQYGNKDFSGGLERAWLNSTLKISPLEQIDFLRRLKRRELKVEPKTIDSVLAILPVETDRLGFKVVGKTGSDSSWDDESLRNGPQFRVGWYVGYLEANSRQYVFASALKAASEDRTFVYSGREAKELALSALKSVSLASKVTQDFSRKSWLKDFQQLKQIISNTYPNLDSIVEVEKLDLPGLSRKTQQALENSSTNPEAIKALQDFIDQFHDGHFHLEAPYANTSNNIKSTKALVSKSDSGLEACKTIVDAEPTKNAFSFPTSEKLGFSKIETQLSSFAFTTVNIKNHKIGFLKIPSFVAGNYPETCEKEWETYRKSISTERCDESCQDTFKHQILPNRLLKEIEQSIEALKKEKINALVVDLTNNGGGNDWVSAVTRMLTSKPILCGQFGFIRHPHWVKHFAESKRELMTKSASAKTDDEKQKVRSKLDQVESDLEESKKECRRSQFWVSKSHHPACSLVVRRQLTECNPPEELNYKVGAYDGPLFLLVNKNTASASEDLVGRHKDSATATVIGERTLGSGCGFTNGGIDLRLKKSGLVVKMSDCARFLRDGKNEVHGIKPDIELPMDSIDTEGFTVKLTNALSNVLQPGGQH